MLSFMAAKTTPFTRESIEALTRSIPTPFHIYDEAAIVRNARHVRRAFDWNNGFREYFAVKAAPNPFLIRILAAQGFGCDCSSLPELALAERCGVVGESIMFTSNDTPAEEFREARRLGAIINLDDLTHLDYLERHAGLPELLSFRFNPGAAKAGNAIIGHPEDAKYGLTREQLFEGYRRARDRGVRRFGLHTMVASNELDPSYFVHTTEMLCELVGQLSRELGIAFEFVNIGGGIGIPYRPDEQAVDLDAVSSGARAAFGRTARGADGPLRLYMECGRMITGPYGWLVSRVRHLKHTYKHYVGLDACMTDLMRPAMYDAYHHITVLGKEDAPATHRYDVTGSLCENNDKFAIDRHLPEIGIGDLLALHDAGAHGHAMGFNYNGKLRSAELLLRPDGSYLPIRRAETMDDYFATLDFGALPSFTPAPLD